jgi:hypothetical protein
MYAKHPEVAAKWDKKYGGKVTPKKRKAPKKRGS